MTRRLVVMSLAVLLGTLPLGCGSGGSGGDTPRTLVSIAVTPAASSVVAGQTLQFRATGTYSDSSTADLTGSATWLSSNVAVATMSTAGLLTGVAAGTAIVSATSGITGSTTVAVTSAAPQFEVACSGTGCGAESPTRYAGSGTGIWRYRNGTASAATVALSIENVHEGQKAVLLFANGTEAATTLPSPGALPAPIVADLLPAIYGGEEGGQSARDRSHSAMLARNRELGLSLGALALEAAARGPAPLAAAAAPVVVGDTRTWYDLDPKPAVPYSTVAKRTCTLSTGRQAVFWVDVTATSGDHVTEANLDYFTATFCGASGGYTRVTTLRGDVWGTGAASKPSLYVQDSAGALLDVNVVFLYVPAASDWAGYFDGTNNMLKTSSAAAASSNEALVFFMNARGVRDDPGFYASTLLHELTHMVNFYQRDLIKGATYDTWVDEMSAMMTEDVVTPVVTPDHFAKVPEARVLPYLRSGGGKNLIAWGDSAAANPYDGVGTLGAFFNRRYGLAIYSKMVNCPTTLSGVACMDSLVRGEGGVGFADEFARMGATVYGLLPSVGAIAGYGLPEKVSDGYTISAIDLAAWADRRPATATPLGATFTATTQTYWTDTVPAGGTVYRRNGVVVPAGATLMLVVQ